MCDRIAVASLRRPIGTALAQDQREPLRVVASLLHNDGPILVLIPIRIGKALIEEFGSRVHS